MFKKYLINLTLWLFTRLGYTIIITKGFEKNAPYEPMSKIEIHTNGKVGL